MTTFNTVEDLMQVLDANPHLLEGLRSRLLTRELLELPETMARLASRVDQIAAQMAEITERADRLIQRMDRTAEQLGRLRDDVGTVKGMATDGLAHRVAPAIANAMELRLTKNLDGADLSALTAGQDISAISQNALESFLLSDLIMETTDGDGQTFYVAVESSYTADDRDTRRAIRNAEFMTRFTGQPARAAIAAVRTDWDIDAQIASGAVYWYRLPARLLRGI
ncbi:hypothetical protein GBAR_LOCUS27307 [Geodia barretti]|jgi:hypothetical protein|uniref:Uncharacterized protein n=1 Tax=Geodia barretti TaxID=519541 RepID=A0AA35TJR7_GEOBA|nr:hypothetical protein GBAR_LOCUS27307 [Geodia barretti]